MTKAPSQAAREYANEHPPIEVPRRERPDADITILGYDCSAVIKAFDAGAEHGKREERSRILRLIHNTRFNLNIFQQPNEAIAWCRVNQELTKIIEGEE